MTFISLKDISAPTGELFSIRKTIFLTSFVESFIPILGACGQESRDSSLGLDYLLFLLKAEIRRVLHERGKRATISIILLGGSP